MDVENLLKEQVKLLKSSFADDVITAILRENPEFKKYMDFQESQKCAGGESESDVSNAVNIELNKNEDKSKDVLNPKKSEKLSRITIQKVDKNAQTSTNGTNFVFNQKQNVDLKSAKPSLNASKNNITITKSEKTKRYISKRCWYDGSEYECTQCNLVLFQYRSFRPHLQKYHQLSAEKINELSIKAKQERDAKKYKCKICQENIFHDKTDIMYHLEKSHKMTLKNYELNYQQEFVSQNKIPNEESKSKTGNDMNDMTSRLSSKIGISITRNKAKQGSNESYKNGESTVHVKVNKVTDASDIKKKIVEGSDRDKKEQEKENADQKNNPESSSHEQDSKNYSSENQEQLYKNSSKETKGGENEGLKRKINQDEHKYKENETVSANKKFKSEHIERGMKSNKEFRTSSSSFGNNHVDNEQNKFKSYPAKNLKEEVKMSSEKGNNYIVALWKEPGSHNFSHTGSIHKDKLPKGKIPNISDKKAEQNKAKNTREKVGQSNTSQDPKAKASTKYGQKYKESISFSQINNDPHFETSRSWYDGVEYQCNFCNIIFFEIVNFRSHIRKAHEIPKEVMTDICNDAKKAREDSEYECLICEAPVMYTKDDIRIHLKSKHSLSLKQYEEIDFNDEDKIETMKKSDDSISATNIQAAQTAQSTTPTEKKWFDERAIICPFCDNEYWKVDACIDHLNEAHPEKKDSINKSSLQASQQYKCKMQSCKSKIKRHKKNISDHLRKGHSLTIEDYEKMHEQVMDDQSIPTLEISDSKSVEQTEQANSFDESEYYYAYDQEYYKEYENEDSYDFDDDYFTKKYFCPLQSCDQAMYQEDIESGLALDHFKFEHYLSVEEIADNLAHLEDMVSESDESVERISYNCPVKDCNFTIHQTMANTSALAMHLGFQHQMIQDQVLLNIFYFANLVKREVSKEQTFEEFAEQEFEDQEFEENDINDNTILKRSVVERKRYMRGIEMTRKESIFHCKVCKSEQMTEGAADLHLKIHHDASPQEIKINLGLIVL